MDGPLWRCMGILGFLVLVGMVYLLSADRRAVRWRQVLWGFGLQAALAVLLLRVEAVRSVFGSFTAGVEWVMRFSDVGARRLFGNLVEDRLPVTAQAGGVAGVVDLGGVVMLKILPTLIFVSSLMAVLHHFGVLQRIVQGLAWLMERTMKVSGAEALSGAANVFLGMTEAPLLVRPYLPAMTSSELMAVMVGGFATISGSMMAVYTGLFGVPFEQLLAASILSAPAALALTKLALPEKETPATLGQVRLEAGRESVNGIDAAARGAATGLTLALNVGAMLLAFAAGLALLDGLLAPLGRWLGLEGPLTLTRMLGWLFTPVALLLGVPPPEAGAVGELLGTKIALNEYFAYESFSRMELQPRTRMIAAFALCGFANLGSIAIQVGGLGVLAPERRADLARFGLKAMLLGALANALSAILAGLLGA